MGNGSWDMNMEDVLCRWETMSERRFRKFNKCENEFEEERMKMKMGKGTLVVQLTKSEGQHWMVSMSLEKDR